MELATIEMPRLEAKALLLEYQKQLASERTKQDAQITAGYRALARGHSVLKLSEAVQRGGWFDNGLPRVAVVRADATTCWVRPDGRDVVFSSVAIGWKLRNRGALVNDVTVRVHAPRPDDLRGKSWQGGSTVVPSIPPRHRPNQKRIHLFHLLWEVEKWDPTPPRDPALLRWIGGDLWAVVATWELTEIERAVLGAT